MLQDTLFSAEVTDNSWSSESSSTDYMPHISWSDADLMEGRQYPSVDKLGNISYKPTRASYIEPDRQSLLGVKAKVITCLLNSEHVRHKTPKPHLELITRLYSIKDTSLPNDKLIAHDSRFVMENCHTEVSEAGRKKVIEKNAKTPHAFLCGTITECVGPSNPARHQEIINEMLAKGAFYIAYEPYKASHFMALGQNKKTPSKLLCELLPVFEFTKDKPFKSAYCTEDSILVLI